MDSVELVAKLTMRSDDNDVNETVYVSLDDAVTTIGRKRTQA